MPTPTPKRRTCVWRYDETTDAWVGSCGVEWQFLGGDPPRNKVRFCLQCGRTVEVRDAPSTR